MDELDERAFLFRIQVSADAKLLGRIARHKVNKFSLISRFELQGQVMLSGGLLQRGHVCRINIVLIKLQLLCSTNRLSISRITFLTIQSNVSTSVYCDGPLNIRHFEL